MRFHLSEEQRAIQDAVRGTLADTWPMERVQAFAEGDWQASADSWSALMALGLGGMLVSEDQNGAGLGLLEAALVAEEAGAAAAAAPLAGQMLTTLAVARSANGADHMPGLLSGQTVATLALDPRFVPSAQEAGLFLVETVAGGIGIVSAGPDVTITPIASTDRTRPLSAMEFAASAAVELIPGSDPLAAKIRDAALVLIAADALGGAQRVTDLSVDYAKTREQFGQPIGRFQALKHQLAHMALDVEPARAFVWYGAYAHDADLPEAPRAAAMAKAHLADVYVRATRAAIAAHGGIGYTWEYPLNTYFRRAVFDSAWLGAPADHRARAADLAGW